MKSYFATDPVSHKGKTNVWLTPIELVNALGEFDLDPCAYPKHVTAKNLIYPPKCGLEIPWNGRVWLNPPYGKSTKVWLEKLASHGNGIALVFARLETIWLQKFIASYGFFAIKGRISFISPEGIESTNAGCGSILIPFGEANIKSIKTSGIEGHYFKNS